MQYILLVLVVLAIAAFGAMQFIQMKKKEKFVMQLYRPGHIVSVPYGTWDMADTLTAALPSKDGPQLVVQKGDYRRFDRR